MDTRFLRLIYTAEFLLALVAVFTLWSQVGGQTHLDLMPWYLKLFFGPAMAYAIVRATAAAAGGERTWNAGTLRWTGMLLALAVAAGLITYYFHIYEPNDEEDSRPATQTSVTKTTRLTVPAPARPPSTAPASPIPAFPGFRW